MTRRVAPLALLFSSAVIVALWAPLILIYMGALASPIARGALWSEWTLLLSWKSLQLSVVTAIAATSLGVPLGFLIARGPLWARGISAALVALALGVPPVLAAAPFFSLGGPDRFPLIGCAAALALVYCPVVTFGVAAALASLPREEEEAALALSGPLRAWRGVLGRRIAPAIAASAGIVAALCLWEMGAPDLLSYPTLSSEIYRQLNSPTALGDPNARAALTAWPIPILALLFLLPALRAPLPSRASGENGARSNWLALAAPLLLISPGFLLWRFARELEWNDLGAMWETLAANSDALTNTLVTATCAATICTFLALALCLTWRTWPRGWRRAAIALVLAPGLFAPVVIGVALIGFFNRDATGALYDSALGMTIWGNCARFLPLAVAIVWNATARLDPETLWAASNLGAGAFRVARTVAVPLLASVLAGAWGLVWAWSAGELTVTVLVHGPGGDTLPIPIFNFLHAGIASDVAVLCLLLMGLCGGAMALAVALLRRGRV